MKRKRIKNPPEGYVRGLMRELIDNVPMYEIGESAMIDNSLLTDNAQNMVPQMQPKSKIQPSSDEAYNSFPTSNCTSVAISDGVIESLGCKDSAKG
jgi:hypothetical protein